MGQIIAQYDSFKVMNEDRTIHYFICAWNPAPTLAFILSVDIQMPRLFLALYRGRVLH